MAIMRQVGKSKPTVWRWQQRFLEEGVDGLLRDRNRGTGKRPLSPEVRALVLAKTVGEKPPNASHWSLRTMAKAVGIGHTSVQRIWAEHGLKPHLVSTFKLSNDPGLAEKVADVVGLYLNPPDKTTLEKFMPSSTARLPLAPDDFDPHFPDELVNRCPEMDIML